MSFLGPRIPGVKWVTYTRICSYFQQTHVLLNPPQMFFWNTHGSQVWNLAFLNRQFGLFVMFANQHPTQHSRRSTSAFPSVWNLWRSLRCSEQHPFQSTWPLGGHGRIGQSGAEGGGLGILMGLLVIELLLLIGLFVYIICRYVYFISPISVA